MATGYLSEVFVSFQGEGLHVGRRQLFVRLGGCQLRCRYCDTPDSLERRSLFRVVAEPICEEWPNPVDAGTLLARLGRLLEVSGPVDGAAITGGEPLLQAGFLADLLRADVLPRPRVLETGGTLADSLGQVLPHVDAVSMDIKLPSNSGERPLWEEHARFLAVAGEKAYVKVLVDDGTVLDEVDRAASLVAQVSPGAPVFLQPISSTDGVRRASPATLERVYRLFRARVPDVRVVPQTHTILGVP